MKAWSRVCLVFGQNDDRKNWGKSSYYLVAHSTATLTSSPPDQQEAIVSGIEIGGIEWTAQGFLCGSEVQRHYAGESPIAHGRFDAQAVYRNMSMHSVKDTLGTHCCIQCSWPYPDLILILLIFRVPGFGRQGGNSSLEAWSQWELKEGEKAGGCPFSFSLLLEYR